MYVVLDTSVVIAALLKRDGLCDRLIELADQGKYIVCTSSSILSELRKELAEKGFAPNEIGNVVSAYSALAISCDSKYYSQSQVEKDEHVIGCLHACQADLIVSLDRRLLRRLKQANIAAVHPAVFIHYFQ